MINFFQNLALFRVKNANFSQFFGRKYLKNHNIGPWWLGTEIIASARRTEDLGHYY
jgi:hypothetical protein